jgi:hypothetical protein
MPRTETHRKIIQMWPTKSVMKVIYFDGILCLFQRMDNSLTLTSKANNLKIFLKVHSEIRWHKMTLDSLLFIMLSTYVGINIWVQL